MLLLVTLLAAAAFSIDCCCRGYFDAASPLFAIAIDIFHAADTLAFRLSFSYMPFSPCCFTLLLLIIFAIFFTTPRQITLTLMSLSALLFRYAVFFFSCHAAGLRCMMLSPCCLHAAGYAL